MQLISSWVNLHVISFYEPLLFFSLNTATDYNNFPAQIQVRFFQIISKFPLRKSALLPKWNIFRIVKFQTMGFYLICFTTLKHWSGRPLRSVILRHVLLFFVVFHALRERHKRSSVNYPPLNFEEIWSGGFWGILGLPFKKFDLWVSARSQAILILTGVSTSPLAYRASKLTMLLLRMMFETGTNNKA